MGKLKILVDKAEIPIPPSEKTAEGNESGSEWQPFSHLPAAGFLPSIVDCDPVVRRIRHEVAAVM